MSQQSGIPSTPRVVGAEQNLDGEHNVPLSIGWLVSGTRVVGNRVVFQFLPKSRYIAQTSVGKKKYGI